MPTVIQFDRTGGPENLLFRDVPLPMPGPGEVRYTVEAFSLNRGDLFWLADTYYNSPALPARIGHEACGVVDAIGAGVTHFKVGDRVVSLVQEDGRYCVAGEFAVTPERYLVAWPDGLSPEEACSVWCNALTPYYVLIELANIQPGQSVLVTGASSTTGIATIQMAKLLGVQVLTTSRTNEKRDFLLGLGADCVIATDSQNVGERMRTETAGRGVDVILDTVAGSLMPRYFEGLAHDAKIFIVGALEGNYELTGPFLPLIQAAATIMGFSLYNNNRIAEQFARAKAFIGNAITEKHLRPVIDRVVPFKDAITKGYCDLAKGDQCGRIVVRVP